MAENTVQIIGSPNKKKKKHKGLKIFLIILLIILLLPLIIVGVLAILLFDNTKPSNSYDGITIDQTTIVKGMLAHSLDDTYSDAKISISLTEDFFNKLLSTLIKGIDLSKYNLTGNLWLTIDGTDYNFNISISHPIYSTRVVLSTKLTYEENANGFEGLLFKIQGAKIGKLALPLSLVTKYIPSDIENTINETLAKTGFNLKFELDDLSIKYAIEDLRNDISNAVGQSASTSNYGVLLQSMMNYIDIETDGRIGIAFDLQNFVYNSSFFDKCDSPFLDLTKEELDQKISFVSALANENKIQSDHIDEIFQFFLVGYDNMSKDAKGVFDANYKTKFKDEYHIVVDYLDTGTTYNLENYGKVYTACPVDLQDIINSKYANVMELKELIEKEEGYKKLFDYFKAKEVLTDYLTEKTMEDIIKEEKARGEYETLQQRVIERFTEEMNKARFHCDKLKKVLLGDDPSIYISNKIMSALFASTNAVGTGYTIFNNDKAEGGENDYHISPIFINDIHTETKEIKNQDYHYSNYFSVVAGLSVNGYQTQVGLVTAQPNSEEVDKLSLVYSNNEAPELGIYLGEEKAPDDLFDLFKQLIESAGDVPTSNAANNIFKFTNNELLLEISSILPTFDSKGFEIKDSLELYSYTCEIGGVTKTITVKLKFKNDENKIYFNINPIHTNISLYTADGGGVKITPAGELFETNLEDLLKNPEYYEITCEIA